MRYIVLLTRRILWMLLPLTLLCGCFNTSFGLEPLDYWNVIHRKSGLYVHREEELRVHAARLTSPPDGAAPGATSRLEISSFFPLGVRLDGFISSKFERQGDYLVWKGVSNLDKYDLKGKTSLGACVVWDKEGAVRAKDTLEIFRLPPPDLIQLDQWSPWVEASSQREGVFGWHAEANEHAEEQVDGPEHPFQYRFRLVLSKRMYP